MSSKRKKAQEAIDLTAYDDDDDMEEERPVKRRRAASKRGKTADMHGEPDEDPGEAGASQAATKAKGKGKGKAKAEAPEKERRVDEMGNTVVYRPTASQDVRARIQRAMPGSAHRMFLVDTRQLSPPGAPGGPSQEFHVLGATGNVYTVRISRSPRCSCPDFGKGHLCKHILFVMLRVLHQSADDPVIWQKALLTSEVEQVLGPLAAAGGDAAGSGSGAGAAVDQSVLASERVRQRFAALSGGAAAAAAAGGAAAGGAGAGAGGGAFGNGVQRPVEGECPICYEEMVAQAAGGRGRGEAITFCMTCGNNMHKDCFDRWASSKRSSGQPVTCVYCRSVWKTTAATGGDGGGKDADGEYINLAQYSDAHRGGGPSLEDLYGTNSYFIMANNGQMGRRQAMRLHAAARGHI